MICGNCGHDAGKHYTRTVPPGLDAWFCADCGCEQYEPADKTIADLRAKLKEVEPAEALWRDLCDNAQADVKAAEARAEEWRSMFAQADTDLNNCVDLIEGLETDLAKTREALRELANHHISTKCILGPAACSDYIRAVMVLGDK